MVVAGDFVYDQQAAGMLETGVMPRETYDEIASLRDGTEEGDLRSRLGALVFLISKLPTDAGSDIGLRANAGTLADLLVENLDAPSVDLRKRVADALTTMVEGGPAQRGRGRVPTPHEGERELAGRVPEAARFPVERRRENRE